MRTTQNSWYKQSAVSLRRSFTKNEQSTRFKKARFHFDNRQIQSGSRRDCHTESTEKMASLSHDRNSIAISQVSSYLKNQMYQITNA